MNPSPEEDSEQSPQTFIIMHEQDQYIALLEYSTVEPQRYIHTGVPGTASEALFQRQLQYARLNTSTPNIAPGTK